MHLTKPKPDPFRGNDHTLFGPRGQKISEYSPSRCCGSPTSLSVTQNSWRITASQLYIRSPPLRKLCRAFFIGALFPTFGHLATVLIPIQTTGPSMLPTLAASGEVVVEDCLTHRLFPEKLARGDLLILESPVQRGYFVCKRLIGLPGDVVCVDPTGQLAPSTEHVVVPKGHIWISGDNAAGSRDSRMYGPVPMALIHGRLLARVSVLWFL